MSCCYVCEEGQDSAVICDECQELVEERASQYESFDDIKEGLEQLLQVLNEEPEEERDVQCIRDTEDLLWEIDMRT